MSIQINRHKQISLLMIVFISSILFFSACSNQTDQKTHLAYVSANIDGAYEQMFKELSLGLIFDFNLKPLSEDQAG
ncbi:hypothetical protein [Caldalkalibacillus mannanilyticus]|uniref:hypothetical protein n=1 Tax=Caldalkalibacillus mannanilyticus TaxID=1418 RepID=UPI00046838AD|nr:hypothetical protein [Caldalkalibacillus mannanilyticus]